MTQVTIDAKLSPIDFETIDLSEFADPAAEVILIDRASGGKPESLLAIQNELRREEGKGWCKILYMTDDLAVVRWHEQFVLTIEDTSLAVIGEAP